MGRGSKGDQPDTTPQNYNTPTSTPTYQYQSESVAAPTRAVTDSESMARDIKEGRLSGFVGHGTTLTGETHFQAMLRVDGHLQGSVSSDSGTLLVGTNGQVDANVAVASALVNGQVNGDIVATEKIQLGRTARVIGNIQTPRLILEDGALFEGSCSMIKAKEAIDSKAAETQSHYSVPEYTTTSSTDSEETDALFSDSIEEDEDEEKADAAIL
jgi:cytoskeletal protein CcmA (bactofilin family)